MSRKKFLYSRDQVTFYVLEYLLHHLESQGWGVCKGRVTLFDVHGKSLHIRRKYISSIGLDKLRVKVERRRGGVIKDITEWELFRLLTAGDVPFHHGFLKK